jgi:hypothetical protein
MFQIVTNLKRSLQSDTKEIINELEPEGRMGSKKAA